MILNVIDEQKIIMFSQQNYKKVLDNPKKNSNFATYLTKKL
jgi:hypothetical protein